MTCNWNFYFYKFCIICGWKDVLSVHRFKMSNYREAFQWETYYLISNKWFNGSVLFENSDDYKAFMLYVIENLLVYKGIILSAYSILPDHFHLVIKNRDEWYELSDFMRKIQVSYAMFFKRSKWDAVSKWVPVFQWRFKATPIDTSDLEHIESCVSYDPINHGYIDEIDGWPYTSVHQLINTGYDAMNQTHIKIYNDGRDVKKYFFTEQEHQI